MGESDAAFHVVCRDCKKEEIAGSERDARVAAADHRSVADHRVQFDRIDAGARGVR
ncbi:MAG: hypothetical protein ABEH90_10170 [Halolamina sp.]